MSNKYLFCCTAKGLQSYIMRGGKLRDMVGATSLIDKLSDREELRKWLTEDFGIVTNRFEILQAAAGSARIKILDEESANTVNRLWPLWCHAWAPDLEVVQHLEPWKEPKTYAEVAAETGRRLERNRNFPAPRLPEAGPFAQRAPRTGEPAVWKDPKADDELVDLASKRKRKEREALAGGLPPIAKAFDFTTADQLPDHFEQVSGGEGAYLAVIHADGNLLGQMFLNVGQAMEKAEDGELKEENAIALFQFLSEDLVANGTRAAVKQAMSAVKGEIERTVAAQRKKAEKRPASANGDEPEAWPFAPLVLAGDDVTVVCRADLGLPFTEAFLKEFAKEMKRRLGWLSKDAFPDDPTLCKNAQQYRGLWRKLPQSMRNVIPTKLSAGAGVVFCTDHYPFSLAYELCESVSKQAKDAAKKIYNEGEKSKAERKSHPRSAPPSALSFVRITGASAPTDFKELLKGVLKGADGTVLTGCPYFVDEKDPDEPHQDQPQFGNLRAVFDEAKPHPDPDDRAGKRMLGLPSGSLRGLLNLQRTDSDPDHHKVREAVERMKEVAGGYNKDTPRSTAWRNFESKWKKLCGWSAGEQDWGDLRLFDASGTTSPDTAKRSPLLDLLTLLAVRNKDGDDGAPQDSGDPATTSDQSESAKR